MIPSGKESVWRQVVKPVVIVGALGYFVDIYDLILFSIVRQPSLISLGYHGSDLASWGKFLLNVQMIGMLLGGLIWGILGDRRGRVELLFGSILLYSAANIANGWVHGIEGYAICRFLAGLGLAGELGGSVTLVAETLGREVRGYGTMIVAVVGVLGAVVGGFLADWVDWRMSYFIGGGMGLLLLLLRISVVESKLFQKMQTQSRLVSRGQFFCLFTDGERRAKYLRCIGIGLPTWFVLGLLVTFAPEFAQALHIRGVVKASYAVSCLYMGLTFGDLLSGLLSQWLASRKRIVAGFLLFTLAGLALFFLSDGQSAATFYRIIFILGLGVGYWVIFVTIGTEQFGTNLRATVTTTIPNFVRGSVVPISLLYSWLAMYWGNLWSAGLIGVTTIGIALWSLHGLEETHGRSLDFHEIT